MNVFIETLGCPKNEADSRVLTGIFLEKNHTITDDPQRADLVVVNTCGFILDAAEESIQRLIIYSNELKKRNKNVKVMAMGCLVQRYQDELVKEIPEVDYWIGLDSLENTCLYAENPTKKVNIPKKPYPIFDRTPAAFAREKTACSYIKIGDGCNRACEFCSIPTFKGEHISRNPQDIKKEFVQLIQSGKRELILVDQDITQYRYGNTGLSHLVRELSQVEGDYWLRLMYMHPDHISTELFKELKDVKHLIRYFDIPVQHGSDKVLKGMGRRRTASQLKEQINAIREMFPDVSLRTTIMLGFPGEGQKEFEQLKQFMEEVRFDKVGFFIFSPEEGTPVSKRHYELEEESVLQERLEDITDLQREISLLKNELLLGTQMQLIVDSYEGDSLVCRSYRDAPDIDSEIFVPVDDSCVSENPAVGEFIEAIITDYDDYDLEAERICD